MLDTGVVLDHRYELEKLIARGGMADVYAASDRRDGTKVAVKLVRSMSDADRFQHEIAMLRVLDHPAIVRQRDVGEFDGLPYLVMDHVEGSSLKEILDEAPLADEQVARIGRDVAAALSCAHGLGITHRDVKPGNILLSREGDARLTDFGIARLEDHTRLTATGMTVGTAGYLAPEQVSGGPVGPVADIYALGLVLLECFTGEPAFPGTTAESVLARLHRDPDIPVDLPTEWRMLIRAMTSREPADRPSSTTVRAALARVPPDLGAIPDPLGTEELPQVGAPMPRRSYGSAMAVVVVVVVLGLVSALGVSGLWVGDEGADTVDEEQVTDEDPVAEPADDDGADEADELPAAGEEEAVPAGGDDAGASGGDHPRGGPPGQQGGGPPGRGR